MTYSQAISAFSTISSSAWSEEDRAKIKENRYRLEIPFGKFPKTAQKELKALGKMIGYEFQDTTKILEVVLDEEFDVKAAYTPCIYKNVEGLPCVRFGGVDHPLPGDIKLTPSGLWCPVKEGSDKEGIELEYLLVDRNQQVTARDCAGEMAGLIAKLKTLKPRRQYLKNLPMPSEWTVTRAVWSDAGNYPGYEMTLVSPEHGTVTCPGNQALNNQFEEKGGISPDGEPATLKVKGMVGRSVQVVLDHPNQNAEILGGLLDGSLF